MRPTLPKWLAALAVRALAVPALATPLAAAHDFWLEPAATVLRVGRDPVHLDRFFVSDAQGELDVEGESGRDPASRVVALRAERGQSRKMGLERYSRCAKALVQVGPAAPLRDRELGLPLELRLLDDPVAIGDGGAFAVRPTFGEGRVRFATPRGVAGSGAGVSWAGCWMVKSVHMAEAPRETRLDWESFWASLTLVVPAAEGRNDVLGSGR